jgi:hypothetical protein
MFWTAFALASPLARFAGRPVQSSPETAERAHGLPIMFHVKNRLRPPTLKTGVDM